MVFRLFPVDEVSDVIISLNVSSLCLVMFYSAKLRMRDSSTYKFQSQMTFRLYTLFLKFESH